MEAADSRNGCGCLGAPTSPASNDRLTVTAQWSYRLTLRSGTGKAGGGVINECSRAA
jgi:hypothetical protein